MKTQATITGHGHTHDGRACFTVMSQTETNLWHIVVVGADRLICDCRYGQYHPETPCAHRKIVRERLLAEREAAQVAAAKSRGAAPMYISNAGISLFKA
jgi:hypothetical protein